MSRFAEGKMEATLQKTGEVLPASIVKQSGDMVTVALELRDIPYVLPQTIIPLFGPQYIQYPMQSGDKGIIIPVDTYLGGISGQGGGIADLTSPANFSAPVFLPISSTEQEGADGQVVTIYGPEGVTTRGADSNTTFLLTPDSITIATPTQSRVTVGSTAFTLTDGMWNPTGQAGKLRDETASTSPAIMYEDWKSLISRCSSHVHSNGNGGNNTGSTAVRLSGSIAE